MSTPVPIPDAQSRSRVHALRRRFQDMLAVEPAATSLDGREFRCETPVETALPPGSFVAVETEDGRSYLGRMLESDILEREGPELGIGGESGLASLARTDDMDIESISFRIRIRYAQGTGVLVGRIAGDRVLVTGDDDRFADAAISAASGEQLKQYLESNTRNRPVFPIGVQAGFEPAIPATMFSGGFGRHTFLVGQSGSGKTYSLGVILEQILLETDLRLIIIDPNSDFVRIREVRDEVAARDPDLADRYREAVRNVRVFRPTLRDDAGAEPLKIRFSNLTERAQAMVLRLDPLEDRDEFEAFRTIVGQMDGDGYSLADVQRMAMTSLSQNARQIALRIAGLGVAEWDIWAAQGEASLAELSDDWRAIVLDVGGFEQMDEKSLIANAVLQTLWLRRNERQPYLIVIDEAHNICPQEPDGTFQHQVTERTISIAAEGRKFGLYLLLSTQRPSKIHTNVLSQCDNLVLMRMNSADDLHQLKHTFSFVPESLFDRSSTFAQGESLIAGKIAPLPLMINFGGRVSQEGGSDVADDWTRRA